jgi:hypothetical protein
MRYFQSDKIPLAVFVIAALGFCASMYQSIDFEKRPKETKAEIVVEGSFVSVNSMLVPQDSPVSQRAYVSINENRVEISTDISKIEGDYVLITFDDAKPRLFRMKKGQWLNNASLQNSQAFISRFASSKRAEIEMAIDNKHQVFEFTK